ncbi:hypothetical protein BRAS3843_1450001 [Bradyrhizobium sp. STM 3843]|nr:hypothetical protein BRAS3843_1450001 [Bradyrhizobium sp. STM 3843]
MPALERRSRPARVPLPPGPREALSVGRLALLQNPRRMKVRARSAVVPVARPVLSLRRRPPTSRPPRSSAAA